MLTLLLHRTYLWSRGRPRPGRPGPARSAGAARASSRRSRRPISCWPLRGGRGSAVRSSRPSRASHLSRGVGCSTRAAGRGAPRVLITCPRDNTCNTGRPGLRHPRTWGARPRIINPARRLRPRGPRARLSPRGGGLVCATSEACADADDAEAPGPGRGHSRSLEREKWTVNTIPRVFYHDLARNYTGMYMCSASALRDVIVYVFYICKCKLRLRQ